MKGRVTCDEERQQEDHVEGPVEEDGPEHLPANPGKPVPVGGDGVMLLALVPVLVHVADVEGFQAVADLLARRGTFEILAQPPFEDANNEDIGDKNSNKGDVGNLQSDTSSVDGVINCCRWVSSVVRPEQ